MLKIKTIIPVIVWMCFTMGCKTTDIHDAYQFGAKEATNTPYGCWLKISYTPNNAAFFTDSLAKTPGEQYIKNFAGGELLFMTDDSVFLLISDGLVMSYDMHSITTATLITHKNMSGKYMLISTLFIIPSLIGAISYPEYAAQFLLLAAPTLIAGSVTATIEKNKKSNELSYPPLDPKVFKTYARYPAGKPDNIDLTQLTLKKD